MIQEMNRLILITPQYEAVFDYFSLIMGRLCRIRLLHRKVVRVHKPESKILEKFVPCSIVLLSIYKKAIFLYNKRLETNDINGSNICINRRAVQSTVTSQA